MHSERQKGDTEMTQKFGAKLTGAQMDFARRVERAGLATISQAIKSIERGETAKIEEWKRALAK